MRKEVSNVKVTLSSGKELFNTSGKATNVIWIDKQGHTTGYDNNLMKTPEVRNPTQNQAVILKKIIKDCFNRVKISIYEKDFPLKSIL